MKISNRKKLFTLYKKDLTMLKFETLLILGFIVVGNLFLYYKVKTSWPLDAALALSVLSLGFIPLYTFLRAFSFIREEWKENTVYFMMSLPTTGNVIFLSKLLALLTQFFILGAAAIAFVAVFTLMGPQIQQIWEAIRNAGNVHQIAWEFGKVGIIMFLSFAMVIITAFFSAVVGKLFKRFSGLITFVVLILTNYLSSVFISEIVGLMDRSGLNSYIQREMMGGEAVYFQALPNLVFVVTIILAITVSMLLFLATSAIYDKKVEL